MNEENGNRESKKKVLSTQWYSINKGIFQQFQTGKSGRDHLITE